MKNIKEKIMKAIEENRLYDFIASEYYRMSKEELKDVLLETIWVGCENAPYEKSFNQTLASNLSERWED